MTRQEAAQAIGGEIVGDEVEYRDDATGRRYSGPVEDLDELARLLASPDPNTRRDAYSVWCSSTSHRQIGRR